MRSVHLLLISIVAAVALAAPVLAASPATTLIGTDGPGFTITMNKKTVKAGTYVVVVRDRSPIHNFHLIGRGVDKATSVAGVGTKRWKLKLTKGTYNLVCDPHVAIMRGVLKVT